MRPRQPIPRAPPLKGEKPCLPPVRIIRDGDDKPRVSATIYHQDTALRAQVERWRRVAGVALLVASLAALFAVRENQRARARPDVARFVDFVVGLKDATGFFASDLVCASLDGIDVCARTPTHLRWDDVRVLENGTRVREVPEAPTVKVMP